jgi:hypothetical protein
MDRKTTIIIPDAPCNECLLISVCRHKRFLDMKNDCRIIERYLFEPPNYSTGHQDFEFRINKIYKVINPVIWKKFYSPEFRLGGTAEIKCNGFSLLFWIK